MKSNEIDMTTGSLPKKILVYSVPLMLSNVLQVMFNLCDVAVVGKFVGPLALGAVGSTSIIITLTTGHPARTSRWCQRCSRAVCGG